MRVASPVACFAAGHLRSVRVLSAPPLDGHWFGTRLNPPVPYLRAGQAELLLELWFHVPDRWTADLDTDCEAQPPHGDPVFFAGLGIGAEGRDPGSVSLRIELWDGRTLR